MKRLGLKEGHEVPFEVPSYYKYYHYNHQQQLPPQAQSNIHQSNNRIAYFDKSDRSVSGNHWNPAGKSSSISHPLAH